MTLLAVPVNVVRVLRLDFGNQVVDNPFFLIRDVERFVRLVREERVVVDGPSKVRFAQEVRVNQQRPPNLA